MLKFTTPLSTLAITALAEVLVISVCDSACVEVRGQFARALSLFACTWDGSQVGSLDALTC